MEGAAMVVTPLYAGLLALCLVVLSLRVIDRRRAARVSLGDGGNADLQRAIRGHANFCEYVPFALLLLAILELSRFSIYTLHAIGIALVIARVLHGYALSFTRNFPFGRYWGALLTFVVIIAEALMCLYQAYLGHVVWFAA
jgi:uncharacterized membrane protein YecN with MAPEG domain